MTPTPTTSSVARTFRPLVALSVLLAAVAAAQSPPDVSVAALREQVLEQRSRKEAAEWEVGEYQSRLSKPAADSPTGGEFVQAVIFAMNVSYPATRTAMLPPADRLKTERESAAKRWGEVTGERAKFQQAVEAGQTADGFDWATRSVPPLRSDALDATLLGVGGVAVLVGLWGTARRLRVPWRRWRRARAMRSAVAGVLIVAALTAAGCDSPPPPARPWADSRREEQTTQLRTATAEADDAAAKADVARRDAAGRFQAPERELVKLRDVLAATLVIGKLKAAAADEKATLDTDKVRLDELSKAGQEQKRAWALGRGGVGLLLLAVTLTPFLVADGWERGRRKADADTCPRCLATGTMKERRTVLECGGCGYRCPPNTRGMARLCFPTVGIRSSGKTHLLVTAYASVKNRNTRTPASVQQAPSMGDEQFNTYIELVLRQRGTAGATVHDLPAPIVVCATDADRGGPSTVLVNLFDYSGEMMTQAIAVDDLRRRAVRMDGFLMFFDPTQLYGDVVDGEATLALEDQLAALHQFYLDMLDARGLPPGRTVPVPVAVCVSKFDLVAARSPMGGQALPFLKRLGTDLDPPGERTLRVLRERSAVVEQMLPFMLPGADLRKILREYFGDQFLFFPTSDRGLAGGGRAGAPFGVVEPLLWLLHMHGYRVLKGD